MEKLNGLGSKGLAVLTLLAVVGLTTGGQFFSLADKAPNLQLAPAVSTLQSLSSASGKTVNEFMTARDDFYKRTMGHTRKRVDVAIDIYKLTALQIQYLSYFSFASALILDEANTLDLLDNRSKSEIGESKGGAQLLNSLKDLLAIKPALAKCISDVKSRNSAIEQAFNNPTATDSAVKFDVATLNGTVDTIRDRNSQWLKCQGNLEKFDRSLGALVASNPMIFDELDKQSKREKTEQTMLHSLCTMLLVVAAAGGSRFAAILNDIFSK
ncbi:hypothetical protein G5S35_01105 [Paraburkholderia tropica]|uniref:hypothetical protein n=1 Tax=Paraburkholderia tropica TaxID=92647 RepID=UPI00160039B7|nr:hypothetical protein [Paraburkholderia tropica]QNB10297.1 hypothetical protein G5S35_01105 [Paraburkholderia tropica]